MAKCLFRPRRPEKLSALLYACPPTLRTDNFCRTITIIPVGNSCWGQTHSKKQKKHNLSVNPNCPSTPLIVSFFCGTAFGTAVEHVCSQAVELSSPTLHTVLFDLPSAATLCLVLFFTSHFQSCTCAPRHYQGVVFHRGEIDRGKNYILDSLEGI